MDIAAENGADHVLLMDDTKNVSIHLVGSDDVSDNIKMSAANVLNRAIEAGWPVARIAGRFEIDDIAGANELVEAARMRGGRRPRPYLQKRIISRTTYSSLAGAKHAHGIT